MNGKLRKLAGPAVLALGIGAAATAMQSADEGVRFLDAQAEATGPEVLAQSFREASRIALPGVVYVEVESAPRQVSQAIPFEGFPFEDLFRGQPAPTPRAQRGSGSGFIITEDGYVLTNNHVVDGARSVRVTLTDRRQFEAEVVGRDPNTDVAVLKIDATGLPTVRIARTDDIQIGDWVLALGYPLSLGETVTAGIVSAKGRSIGIMQQNQEATLPLEHFIQTDAAINPGNSGGPLVNLSGEVIGINSAIASPTGTYTGYGFAVPINIARRVADDLIRYGAVHRPRLGVQIRDVTPADIDVFDLPNADGSVVASVQDGPAKDGGIELGDVIVALDGQPIRDTGSLMEKIALRQPGDRVTLDVVRYGRSQRLNVTLGQFENASVAPTVAAAPERSGVAQLGFSASELTPQLANQFQIAEGRSGGVIITQVDPSGPAPRDLRGLRIERLNGKAIRNVNELREAAEGLKRGDTVSIIGRLPTGEQIIVNYKLS